MCSSDLEWGLGTRNGGGNISLQKMWASKGICMVFVWVLREVGANAACRLVSPKSRDLYKLRC